MATQAIRRQRQASPERWAKAAARALAEGVQVRQVNASGAWVATSGSQANVAYLLEVVGGIVGSCSCPAGEFGDPCCKHAARFYLDAGLLDPNPEPPAAAAPTACPECAGCDLVYVRDCERHAFPYPPCPACGNERVAA